MKYANTSKNNAGVEVVITVLPLEQVPYFDPENPPQDNTYGVPDEVQVGWVKCDGVFVASPATRVVPSQVTRFQAQVALHQAGLLDDVEAYMALETTDWFIKMAWKEVLHFERNSAMIESLKPVFGLTDAQIDDLFIFAKTIN